MSENEVNLPEVLAEITALFARYEQALVGNDVATLDQMFWPSEFVLRFGSGENLYGIEAIRAFRQARSPLGLARELRNTVITSFGRDFATTSTEFYRGDAKRCGRQSQTWVRFEAGWRVVAGHVSIIELPD
jgi:hypothetical protein